MQIKTWFLPDETLAGELPGYTAVVIDVLRASTTLCHALMAGARNVRPLASIEESLAYRAELAKRGETCVLGGERQGVKIEGFDLGNSPRAYTRQSVGDRFIGFTTTNGTRAVSMCAAAARIWIGCFVNRQALADRLDQDAKVGLVCAGTNRRITREDSLSAGAFVDLLTDRYPSAEIDDASQIARTIWRQTRTCDANRPSSPPSAPDRASLAKELEQTQGGRNLIRLGYQDDLPIAASIDTCPLVPELRSDGTLQPVLDR